MFKSSLFLLAPITRLIESLKVFLYRSSNDKSLDFFDETSAPFTKSINSGEFSL